MSDRLPFDPRRVRPAAEPQAGPALVTPTQVNELVRGAVNRHVAPTLHVVGEVGNLSRPGSGHWYFTLKDQSSELRAVMWRSDAQRVKFEPRPGLEVIASGGIEVYVPRGAYQLQVRRLEPRGVGALELAFRQMREKLAQIGLFDPDRKRRLPPLPERIGLVTSPSGAAIRDILHTLARRFPAVEVLLFPCRVQGDGAAEEIAHAIRLMNRAAESLGGIDVAIVGRGGGSQEDLWAFNEEIVARAIFESRIPIISAVGHEIDVTIADLVADVRAATPTAAAELAVPHRQALWERIVSRLRDAQRALSGRMQLARRDVQRLTGARALTRPADLIHERAQRIDELVTRLRWALVERVRTAREDCTRRTLRLGAFRPDAATARGRERLTQLVRRLAPALQRRLATLRRELEVRLQALEAAHPKQILKRGFAIVRDARTRKTLRSLSAVRDGLRLSIEVADGEFRAAADDPRQPRLFE